MRWKRKPPPKEGQRRIVRRFAWWPICIGAEWRWVERVYLQQEYVMREDLDFDRIPRLRWENVAFVDP